MCVSNVVKKYMEIACEYMTMKLVCPWMSYAVISQHICCSLAGHQLITYNIFKECNQNCGIINILCTVAHKRMSEQKLIIHMESINREWCVLEMIH